MLLSNIYIIILDITDSIKLLSIFFLPYSFTDFKSNPLYYIWKKIDNLLTDERKKFDWKQWIKKDNFKIKEWLEVKVKKEDKNSKKMYKRKLSMVWKQLLFVYICTSNESFIILLSVLRDNEEQRFYVCISEDRSRLSNRADLLEKVNSIIKENYVNLQSDYLDKIPRWFVLS